MRQTYIHNYARTFAGQMHLKSESYRYCSSAQAIAQLLCTSYWSDITVNTGLLSPEVKQKLAYWGAGDPSDGSGRVTLDEVHAGRAGAWLNPKERGSVIIWTMAVTSIIAAIADNFWDECERQRAASMEYLTQNGLIRQS